MALEATTLGARRAMARRVVSALVVVVCAAALAQGQERVPAGQGQDVAHPVQGRDAAPAAHEHGSVHSGHDHAHAAATQGAADLYTPEDLQFLTHMIVHHEQALEMAALVPSRTDRDELARFARYIDGGQRAEIEQMKSLLRAATDRGIEVPHHHLHGDPPMAGMLSKAQMAALAAAKGRKFERLWLEGMIYHHQGAVDMGLEQQQRQFEAGRRPYGIDVLVDEILVVQRAEITKMRSWLAAWGLSRG